MNLVSDRIRIPVVEFFLQNRYHKKKSALTNGIFIPITNYIFPVQKGEAFYIEQSAIRSSHENKQNDASDNGDMPVDSFGRVCSGSSF